MNNTLGSRIRQVREKKGWSRERLAKLVGCDYSSVSKYEKDERTPSTDMLTKIASSLGVTTDYLLTGELNPALTLSREDVTLAGKISQLSPEDRARVEEFVEDVLVRSKIRSLDEEGQKRIEEYLSLLFLRHRKDGVNKP